MPTVTITTATALSAAHKKKILETVEKKYGSVTATTVVDPTVLGGVSITIDSRQIDASYKGRIATMKQQVLASLAE